MEQQEPRLAAFDAVMYGVEHDPILRSTIIALIVLDREPDIDIAVARVERMTRVVPKLREVVSGMSTSLLPPRWEPDPNFDLAYHLRRYALPPEDRSLRPVLRIAEQMGEQDFDRDRPLWEMALVTGLEDGRAAVVFKIHHSITDGVGSLTMAATLFEFAPGAHLPDGPDPDVAEPSTKGPVTRVADGFAYAAQGGADSVRGYLSGASALLGKVLHDPAGAVTEGAIFASSAARVLAPTGEPMSPLMTDRSLSLRMEVLQCPLADLKAAGKAVGGTLNDAFMAVVSGGLQRYHELHGHPVADVRVNMPVNLRTDGDASEGNQWVPARFLIPTDVDDPAERIKMLGPLLRQARTEPALGLSDFLMRRLVQLPDGLMTQVAGGMMKGTDVAATNVPGPPIPVYLAGSEVTALVPFAPKAGAALNIALMSYNGTVSLGVNMDTAAIRDPDSMLACLADALEEVVAVGRVAAAPAPAAEKKLAAKKAPAKKPAAKKKAPVKKKVAAKS